MKQFLTGIALMVVGPLLKKASPVVRKKVHELVDGIQEAAAETDNKFDDRLADFLHDVIFGEHDEESDEEESDLEPG